MTLLLYKITVEKSAVYLNFKASTVSAMLKSKRLYPSRLNASTAVGPSQTLPSILGVKWTPRNGRAGLGTWKEKVSQYVHSQKLYTQDGVVYLFMNVYNCLFSHIITMLMDVYHVLQFIFLKSSSIYFMSMCIQRINFKIHVSLV